MRILIEKQIAQLALSGISANRRSVNWNLIWPTRTKHSASGECDCEYEWEGDCDCDCVYWVWLWEWEWLRDVFIGQLAAQIRNICATKWLLAEYPMDTDASAAFFHSLAGQSFSQPLLLLHCSCVSALQSLYLRLCSSSFAWTLEQFVVVAVGQLLLSLTVARLSSL